MRKDSVDSYPVLSTLLKIKGVYPSLRTAEKRVADYLMLHPEDVVYLTVTELAEKCETSESTVVRMCQQAGFRGFQALKIAIAQDVVAPLKNIHEDVVENDDTATVMQKVFAANIQALQNTQAVLDVDALERATQALIKAQKILIIGVGTSGPLVLDFQYKLMRIGVYCHAIIDPHIQLVMVAQLDKGDVVVGISHSGSSKEIVEAVSYAKESGITTISITGYAKSPITKVSDIILNTSAVETNYRSEAVASRVAQLTITDALQVNIALSMKDQALSQIQKSEKLIPGRKY